jgi:hypothetical protein
LAPAAAGISFDRWLVARIEAYRAGRLAEAQAQLDRVVAQEPRKGLDTCLSVYFTRFATRQDFAYDRGDIVFYCRQHERLMAHGRRVLAPERFLEIDHEELVADRERLTRRLIAFVGLEWDDACLRPESSRRIVKTAGMWQARQPVYPTSVERWRRYEPWLGEFRQLLPPET